MDKTATEVRISRHPAEEVPPMETSVKSRIRLRAINGAAKGQVWESATLLRAGRLDALEMVLNDESVSRRHAEVRSTENGWRLCDLASTNGTFLNGVRLGAGQWPVRVRDLVQFGDVAVVVEAVEEFREAGPRTLDQLRIEATAKTSWEDAMSGLAYDSNRCPRPGEK